MSDWGEKDIGGAIAWLRARHPTVPVVAIGHSSGGWLLPFAPNRGELQGALLVASQNGYFRLWPRKTRWFYGFLWHVATPAITRTVGYLPGRLMGGEDLPPNVAREWARWCTSPEFTRADGPERARAYADFPGPVVAYSFEDDTYAPRESVKSLLSFFERARPVWRVGSPRRVGRPIGHFGVFRPTFRELIWSAMLRDVTAIARAIPPGPALPPFSDGALPGAKGGP
jgi:predicted alpha/beta hydrolase